MNWVTVAGGFVGEGEGRAGVAVAREAGGEAGGVLGGLDLDAR